MKKKKTSKSSWAFIILLGAILSVFAILPEPAMAKSITLTAICTIPAIPGVNAPMLESQSVNTAAGTKNLSQDNTGSIEIAAREQLPTIMQEEAARNIPPAMTPNASTPMVTRTLYSR